MSARAPRIGYVLLIAAWAIAVAIASGSDFGQQGPRSVEPRLTASSSTNPVGISSSREATWILRASSMKPGNFVTGTVKIKNSGTVDANVSLSKQNLLDNAPAGGTLSSVLDLRIEQILGSSGKPPKLIYDGKLGPMPTIALGTYQKADERIYSFKVSFPAGSPGNGYQGASTSVDYVWTAVKASGGGGK